MAVGTPKIGTAVTFVATPVNVPYPASIAANDLILLLVSFDATANDAAAAGFLSVPMTSGSNPQNSVGSDCRHRVLYKVAAGTESGNLSVTISGSSPDGNACLVAFPGVDTTTPFDEAHGNGPAASTTHTSASVSGDAGDAIILSAGIDKTSTTDPDYMTAWQLTTGPVSMTELFEVRQTTSNMYGGAAYTILGSSYTGTTRVTSNDSDEAALHVIVLNAAAGGGSPTTVTPVVATGTASANSPTVQVKATPPAANTTGLALAPNPTVKITATPPTANTTGLALAPNPTVQVVVTPPTATATGEAFNPINVGENLTRVTPPTAEGTASANSPTVQIVAAPPAATATGDANDPTLAIRVTPPVANATGLALAPSPTVKVTLTPVTATASGDANDPTVQIVVKPVGATASGDAADPTVVTPSAPTNVISGSSLFSFALGGKALIPIPVITIPGASLIAHALGGGPVVVEATGGASYTTNSLAGTAIVEST